MEIVADLHLHSKYSRAVSKDMVLPIMAEWAKKKGIDLLTTGDWTHPLWFREIRAQLEEAAEGVYKLKTMDEPRFLLTTEVSSIYSQGGKVRRTHNLIFAPSFETAEKINKEFQRRGVNLLSDGRPIMGIPAKNVLELVLEIDKNVLFVPCHVWTPWFSLYGSNSGFDSIEECFGDYAKYIYAVETGLSSDPEMNWRIKELESKTILSFSDAHSPAKMGREATVFQNQESKIKNQNQVRLGQNYNSKFKISYGDIISAIKKHPGAKLKIGYTIEFYPEEGKYHYTGHRNCRVVQDPQETETKGTTCPVCRRPLTVGVMHRVEQLSDQNSKLNPSTSLRPSALRPRSLRLEEVDGEQSRTIKTQNSKLDEYEVRWVEDLTDKRPPFVKLVPLLEVLAEALSSTTASQKVRKTYDLLVETYGSEMAVLLKTEILTIEKLVGRKIAAGIKKVRTGDISIMPGFDGEYGKVKIWPGSTLDSNVEEEPSLNSTVQLGLEF